LAVNPEFRYHAGVSRGALFAAFFFAAFLFLLYQFYLFMAAFFAPLVWAAILALTFYPINDWLVRRAGVRRSLSATVLVLVVTLVAILPSFYLGSVLAGEATRAYHRLQEALQAGAAPGMLEWLRASWLGGIYERLAGLLAQFRIDFSDLALGGTNWISNQIVGQVGAIARNALLSVVNFLIMLVALWFCFRDGDAMAARLKDLLPMEPEHKDVIFARLYTTLTAVVQSMVVVAVTQGVLAGIGYWLIGNIDFSVFLGFVTGFASFVPLAGAAVAWIGAALYLLAIGEVGRAIGLAIWGILVVSSADNWIKPIFIGGRANLPTAFLLIALLGGLQVYGFLGVFLGPVILALLLTFVAIYRDLYVAPPLIQPAVPEEPAVARERIASV
jgi:predicted PurR-regulated permease PerM